MNLKKCLALLMAFALSAVPITALADELAYDDGTFETSAALSLTAAPAVQSDAPGTGVYALDTLSFYLLQVPVVAPASVGGPTAVPAEPTPQTYPVTVQIWNQGPLPGTDWVPGAPLDADLIVTKPDWYTLDLTAKKLTFTGPVRIGIFLRDDSPDPAPLVAIPAVPVHVGVDNISTVPFGHSSGYDSTVLPPADPWLSAAAANFGIRTAVHLVPAFSCQGFLPPFNRTVTMKTGGRTIPLKAMLFNDAGTPVNHRLLTSPPVVQLLYASDENVVDPIDVTDFVVPAGCSNKGQAFRHAGGGMWIYNFKTNKDLPAGIYTILVESGDGTEYLVDPTCTGTFVIESPKLKQLHPPKKPQTPKKGPK